MDAKTTKWLKATGQRMARAAASTMLSVGFIGGGVLNAFDVDWENLLGVGAGAAFVSLLLSIVGSASGDGGPAFGDVEKLD